MLILTGSPRWAWPPWWTWPDLDYCFSGEACHVPPDTAKDGEWAQFAAAVAQRYPRAAAIEVWNEPNVRGFFATGVDPVRYTQLLSRAHDAIKRVDPSMPVLGGSASSILDDHRNRETYGLEPFLHDIDVNGAQGLMDGLSVHAYPHDHAAADILAAVNTARRNAGGLPLWVTEVGASTTDGYDDGRQAALLGLVVRALMRAPDIAAVYVHTLVDPTAIPAADPAHGFGVARNGTDPKPAFCVLNLIFTRAAHSKPLPACRRAVAAR